MSDVLSVSTFASHFSPSNCTTVIAFVILYYDYALTFVDEVNRFWNSGSMSWVSFFFYLNRYLSLLGHVLVMLQYFWDPRRDASMYVERTPYIVAYLTKLLRSSCPSLSLFHQYYAVVVQMIVGILLIFRTYALYDRDHRILLFMLVVSAGVLGFGTWTVVSSIDGRLPDNDWSGMGCVPPIHEDHAKRFAAAWSGVLVFDNMIFFMTIYKSVVRSRGGNRTLLHVLLRDGAIYFGIMAVVTLGNILSFLLTADFDRGFMTTFANVISSTMISRLMLNLRDPHLTSRSLGSALDISTQVDLDTTGELFSTVLEFNVYTSQFTTENNRWST